MTTEPSEIWMSVSRQVRAEIADPTVWLAMRAVQPVVVDGNFFVAGLPAQDEYLAVHLLNNRATTAIEDALRDAAGHILAFRLISGTSVADWNAEKARETANAAADTLSPEFRAEFGGGDFGGDALDMTTFSAASASGRSVPEEAVREVSPTWDKLSERLNHGYKTAPFIKFPHGQAQYVLTAVKLISDTMDAQMPPAGTPRDDAQERALAKAIERFSSIVNLDPLFISLELLRYREMRGKNADIPL